MALSRKILLYSQNRDFIENAQVLQKDGRYTLILVSDIQALFKKVYDEMPHLMIADVHTCDADAFDILSQIKSDIILGHIPLIICTDSPKMGKTIDCGANAYLQSPIAPEELYYHADKAAQESSHGLDINPLTDLAGNRSSLQHVEAVLASKTPFALCYVNIREIAVYNRAYGTQRGDFLIRETARLIKRLVAELTPPQTFIGHLGGDDFIVLTKIDAASALAEKIIDEFDRMIPAFYDEDDRGRGYLTLGDKEGSYEQHAFARLMIAIVTNEWIPYEQVSDMTRTAMQIQHYLKRFPGSAYLKDRRRDTREIIHGHIQVVVPARKGGEAAAEVSAKKSMPTGVDWKEEIQKILKTGRIDVFLQPIVPMKSKNVYGYESLSWFPNQRESYWQTSLMFQMARETGFTKELDVVCAEKALKNAAGIPPNQKLFINLNRETLLDPACLETILKKSPVALSQLVFELTEHSILTRLDQLIESIKFIRSKKIQFAVDDMGGGSVSLRETATLLPDYIKFDCSLVRDICKDTVKQKILSSLMVFAGGIHSKTTAEGIETKEEMRYLQHAGVDFGQGYFIAKPWKMGFAAR